MARVVQEHVRDPERMEMRLQRWRVSGDTLAGFYREAQCIVNGWDLAWSEHWAHWNPACERRRLRRYRRRTRARAN